MARRAQAASHQARSQHLEAALAGSQSRRGDGVVVMLGKPTIAVTTEPRSGRGCASCHVTHVLTGANPPFVEQRNQDIKPYTDLLLHDMGADLANDSGIAASVDQRTARRCSPSFNRFEGRGPSRLHGGRLNLWPST